MYAVMMSVARYDDRDCYAGSSVWFHSRGHANRDDAVRAMPLEYTDEGEMIYGEGVSFYVADEADPIRRAIWVHEDTWEDIPF